MTSRQRLITVLKRSTPDRVPVTLYEFSHLDGARPKDEPGYAALVDMQRRLGETFVHAGADFGTGVGDPNVVRDGADQPDKPLEVRTTIPTPKGDLVGVTRRQPGTLTFWQVKPLIAGPEDCRKWLSLPPRPARPDVEGILRLQRELGEEGLVVLGPGDALGLVCGMFHYDSFVLTLLEDEGLILAMLAAMAERLNDGLRKICAQVKGVCVRFWGPEYAGAPLLNPRKYFPKLVVSFDRPAIGIVNESGNYSIIHCHGFLSELVEYLIELRPTLLEPLEVAPAVTADMTMRQVKDRLGPHMALMGGMEAHELELLSPARIGARVKEILDVAAPGGGFGLLPTSAPIEYPLRRQLVDNYLAYFEAAHKYGTY